MNRAVRNRVRLRAANRCEYCHLPQELAPLARFHVEHIIPRQHGGGDEVENLCLSCSRCNFSKGPNLAGVDSDSGKVAMLFHPRRQNWLRHFRWDGPRLVGITKTGRATIAVLDINHPQRVELRARLLEHGESLS